MFRGMTYVNCLVYLCARLVCFFARLRIEQDFGRRLSAKLLVSQARGGTGAIEGVVAQARA